MTLQERIDADLKEAMRAKATGKLNVLRMLERGNEVKSKLRKRSRVGYLTFACRKTEAEEKLRIES